MSNFNIKDDGSGGTLINQLKNNIKNLFTVEVPKAVDNTIKNSTITDVKVTAETNNNK
jgi:hypothetical protein